MFGWKSGLLPQAAISLKRQVGGLFGYSSVNVLRRVRGGWVRRERARRREVGGAACSLDRGRAQLDAARRAALADGRRGLRAEVVRAHRHRDARALPEGAVLARDHDVPGQDVLRAISRVDRLGNEALRTRRIRHTVRG